MSSSGPDKNVNALPVLLERAARPTISVVIPTINEAKNLPHVLSAMPAGIDEIVIVDGGSDDGTVEVARSLVPDAVIVVDRRKGKGRALRTGFETSTGDIIVMIDADGSMDPSEIPAMVAVLRAGADVAKGSRFMQGGGTDDMEALRRVGNGVLRAIVRANFGGRYSDLCYGYMAFWRYVLPVFDGDSDGFEVETFLNIRALAAGLRIAEVPSFEHRRIHGESNLRTFRDGFRVLRTIFRERRIIRRSRSSHGVPRPRPVWDARHPSLAAVDLAPNPEIVDLRDADTADLRDADTADLRDHLLQNMDARLKAVANDSAPLPR